MDTQLINEVISWAGLLNAKKQEVVELNVSDLILALYVISYFNIKKGCLIVAFLSCEVWGYGVFSDWVTNEFFYIGYAVAYCLLYFYIKEHIKWNVYQLSSLVLMILLEIGMALDAYFHPEVKTDFWRSYEFNVLLLHCYIIASFVDWRLLRIYMGKSAGAIVHILGVNDAARFCCYNIKKQTTSKS